MKRLSHVMSAVALAASALVAMPGHAALVVTANNDASALATALSGGGGVIITSFSLIGAATQQGTFTGGVSAGIGIEKGVILTSGNADSAPGPNSSDSTTTVLGTAGDADLNDLIPGFATNDANVLNFTFTTTTGSLFFRYVFASEEYNEYVGSSFNDVFGFFVNGNNIAVIPGTNTPVSINNVNCGDPFIGAGPNCQYFNNNDLQDGGPFFDIEYDGFTDVFTASLTGLQVDQVYSIKLAIADAGDTSLDSAVFIEGFSGVNPVPEPGSLALVGLGLAGVVALRNRRKRV